MKHGDAEPTTTSLSEWFGKAATKASAGAGRASTFVISTLVIVVWAITGPVFGFSDTWQLVINTGTSIVTFLMVFLIQNSQNRDSAAIQVKLNELIRVSAAHNSFVGIEHLSHDELEAIRRECEQRARTGKTAEIAVAKPPSMPRRAAECVTN